MRFAVHTGTSYILKIANFGIIQFQKDFSILWFLTCLSNHKIIFSLKLGVQHCESNYRGFQVG